MLYGLQGHIPTEEILEVHIQLTKHGLHELGEGLGHFQLLRAAEFLPEHLLETRLGPGTEGNKVFFETDQLELAQVRGYLPGQERPNVRSSSDYFKYCLK